MKEIVLKHPIAEVEVFYVEEYKSIILRQETRKGNVDILMTIEQLKELVEKLELREPNSLCRNCGFGVYCEYCEENDEK
jgi:hypothetical protein